MEILAEWHAIEETSFFNKKRIFLDSMAYISGTGAYENKSWNKGSIFFALNHDILIWKKSVTQRLCTLLVSKIGLQIMSSAILSEIVPTYYIL